MLTRLPYLLFVLMGALAGLATGPRAHAAAPFILGAKLERQIELIHQVKPFTERQDLPSLLVLDRAVRQARETLKVNGPAHMETLQGFQELVISTRFSKNLFSVTRTARTRPMLEEIQRIGQELAKATGFDQTPYTRITASVYRQVQALTRRLIDLQPGEELRASLTELQAPLGRLLSVADGGDHGKTFASGEEIQRRITALYPVFDRVAGSDAAFLLVLEIQGLNEYYAHFARVDTAPDTRQGELK